MRGRLRQIMTNLVSNAVKFTSGGVVSLFLRMDGGQLFLRVEDTGRGIAAADHRTIFQPFEQTSLGSQQTHFGGTGLGLTISRRLCALMGGELVLERSDPGVGSVFRSDCRCAS